MSSAPCCRNLPTITTLSSGKPTNTHNWSGISCQISCSSKLTSQRISCTTYIRMKSNRNIGRQGWRHYLFLPQGIWTSVFGTTSIVQYGQEITNQCPIQMVTTVDLLNLQLQKSLLC